MWQHEERLTPAQRLARAMRDATEQHETTTEGGFVPLDIRSLPHYPAEAAANSPRDVVQAALDADVAIQRVLDLCRRAEKTLEGIQDTLEAVAKEVDERVTAHDTVEVPVTVGDLTVVHRGRIPRHRGSYLAVILAGLGVLASVLGIGPAAPAQAAVYGAAPVPAVTLVASGPSVPVDVTVLSTAADTRYGHAVIATIGRSVLLGTSTGPLVRIRGSVPAAALRKGTSMMLLTDVGDGTTTRAKLTVLRKSQVTVTGTYTMPGMLLVTASATHYDLTTGAYAGDRLSTVTITARSGARVVTTSAQTAVDGSVIGSLPVPAGVWTVTAVRARGADVTGGTSLARTVIVPAGGPAGLGARR